ncbi:MAG TPA: hypothetical protein VJ898_08450 [Natrialbaceae archaeon]|nr:hypothetical protein [Natrialbaceae archaeon]
MAPNSHDRSGRSREREDSRPLDRYRVSEPNPGVVVIYDVENEAAWVRSESAVKLSDVR